VFVGNMSFKTTEETLSEFFKPCGNVLDATIITRGPRSLGYGFVTFSSLAEIEKATKDLNKKELDGREINVEAARPKAPKTGPTKARRTREVSKEKHISKPVAAAIVAATAGATAAGAAAVAAGISADHSKSETTDDETVRKSRPGRRARKNKNREGREIKPREPAEDSKTRIFVANLPFATTDEELVAIFKGYNIKSAAVARLKNGRSKGYGFVETESEEEQQKTLAKFQDIVLDGRTVSLKVARVERPRKVKEATSETDEQKSAPATEVKPTETAKAVEPKKTETKPTEVKKEEAKSVEVKKEVKPVEVKKEEGKPVEVKKEETKPVEVKKEESKPVEVKKEEAKPVEVKKEVKPVEAKKEVKPVEVKKEEAPKASK
ncbi:hypothetical protein PHYBLDRAFT_116905, partial [Phycomyces blakesleeanus NRRL 1555(-)]